MGGMGGRDGREGWEGWEGCDGRMEGWEGGGREAWEGDVHTSFGLSTRGLISRLLDGESDERLLSSRPTNPKQRETKGEREVVVRRGRKQKVKKRESKDDKRGEASRT